MFTEIFQTLSLAKPILSDFKTCLAIEMNLNKVKTPYGKRRARGAKLWKAKAKATCSQITMIMETAPAFPFIGDITRGKSGPI